MDGKHRELCGTKIQYVSCCESDPILDASDPILLLVSNSILENSEQQIARPISI